MKTPRKILPNPILPKFDLSSHLLPDEIITNIVGLNLKKGINYDGYGATFFKVYGIFSSLLRTCKRFNKLLDQPEMWINLGLCYKGSGRYLNESDTRAMVLPFLENVRVEKSTWGQRHIFVIPHEIEFKKLTPELWEIIPELKKMLRGRFSQQQQSILSSKLKKKYFKNYLDPTRYPEFVKVFA